MERLDVVQAIELLQACKPSLRRRAFLGSKNESPSLTVANCFSYFAAGKVASNDSIPDGRGIAHRNQVATLVLEAAPNERQQPPHVSQLCPHAGPGTTTSLVAVFNEPIAVRERAKRQPIEQTNNGDMTNDVF